MMYRILVVDDDIELCDLISAYLGPEGFEVEAVYTGGQAVEKILAGEHNLVVLDVMLPGQSGFDVLRQVREKSRAPVLMLTARGEEVDRIVGLEMGADDYLSKPFNPRELVARIRAILRRSDQDNGYAQTRPVRARLSVGDVELDEGARVVTCAGEQLNLTTVEFDMLKVLLECAGQVVTREAMSEAVLGRRFSGFDRSIDTHISNLRRKLSAKSDNAERIKTIRNSGYMFALPAEHAVG